MNAPDDMSTDVRRLLDARYTVQVQRWEAAPAWGDYYTEITSGAGSTWQGFGDSPVDAPRRGDCGHCGGLGCTATNCVVCAGSAEPGNAVCGPSGIGDEMDKDGAPFPPTSDCLWSPRREARLRARVRKRVAVFDHYGRVCACCGSTENLTVDHVNGDGHAHRAKIGHGSARLYRWLVSNGFPDGFQILCGPCNVSKGCRKSCRLDHAKTAA